MLLGLALALVSFGAGWLLVRLSGLTKGPACIGLAPALGVALLATVLGDGATLGLPSPLATAVLMGLGGAGVALAAHDLWETHLEFLREREHRLAFAVLACTLITPVLISGAAFYGIEVPLSTHDGAFHVEAIQLLRNGATLQTWYPLGFHAMVAAFLGVVPWVDTARGTFDAAFALTYLAPLAVFGLGCVVWRNTLTAAVGALLLALTFEYPYYPQFWSGWPLATTLLMVWGMWCLAAGYLERPRSSVAACAAVLLAGILITHGSELYTVVIGLVLLLMSAWRRVEWARLARHAALALVIGAVLAAPYEPTLLNWAKGGGAIAVAVAYAPVVGGGTPSLPNLSESVEGLFAGQSDSTWSLWANTFGSGVIVDLPLRLVVVLLGALAAFQLRRGRLLLVLLVAFFGLSEFIASSNSSAVKLLYALTFPWGMAYRLAMVQAVAAALLGGGGVVALGRVLSQLPTRWSRLFGPGHDVARRRATAMCWVAAAFMTTGAGVGLAILAAGVAEGYNSFNADDAAAMRWLLETAQPGDVVANDASTDAGIWAPYKANVAILAPRSTPMANTEAGQLMLSALGRLDDEESRAFACSKHIRFLYQGAKQTAWDKKHFFPPVGTLRASPAFEQVFVSAQASVFRLNLSCR